MPTPIQNAREQLQAALASAFPPVGIRQDYELTLRRYTEPADWDDLNMDPDTPERGTADDLVVAVPKVEPVSAQAIAYSGGMLRAGAVKLTLVRTAAVEAFLAARVDQPADTAGGPYPEIERVEALINGEPYQVARFKARLLTVEVYANRRPREV